MTSVRALPAVLAAAAALVSAAPAHAGVLAADAVGCEEQALEQPFVRWLDPANYTLMRGGTFEGGADGWSLGAAKVVKGNEPFFIHRAGEKRSLAIPARTSVTTPVMCVGIEHPTLRFVTRNTGGSLSTLSVAVNFQDAGGAWHTLSMGPVVGDSTWAPSQPMVVLANLLPLLPGERTPVTFTFTTGALSSWSVDDVYVDPYKTG